MPNPNNDQVIDQITQALYAAKADAWDMADKAALVAAIHQVIAPQPSETLEEGEEEESQE